MEEGRTFKRKDAEPQSFWNKETDVSDLSEINRTNYAAPAIRKIRQIRFPLSFFDHKMHGRNEKFCSLYDMNPIRFQLSTYQDELCAEFND